MTWVITSQFTCITTVLVKILLLSSKLECVDLNSCYFTGTSRIRSSGASEQCQWRNESACTHTADVTGRHHFHWPWQTRALVSPGQTRPSSLFAEARNPTDSNSIRHRAVKKLGLYIIAYVTLPRTELFFSKTGVKTNKWALCFKV